MTEAQRTLCCKFEPPLPKHVNGEWFVWLNPEIVRESGRTESSPAIHRWDLGCF